MLDHILGRPSVAFRKIQVFAVLAFWTLYLTRGNHHGPPGVRRLSKFFTSRITPWQTMVMTMLYLYTTRNFGKVVGLESPEPLANLYSRSYFRATWITTALDAGFWTAMRLKPTWFKNVASLVFTAYYLICAEQADEKVRKVRAVITLEHLRVSWNKQNTPYLRAVTALTRPKLTKYGYGPREIRINRPQGSRYVEPVRAWLYFDGSLTDLHKHDKIILDIPGGGFIAQDPRCHDDKLLGWAGRTGLPVLALDYHKAPEHPYPYALHECYDTYQMLYETRGQCIGLSGQFMPKLVVSGDSAGGNLAVGLVNMILQSNEASQHQRTGMVLPKPDGLVLSYPALDMNMPNFISEEQANLMKDRRSRKTNQSIIRKKNEDYRKLTNEKRQDSDDAADSDEPPPVLRPKSPGPEERRLSALQKDASQLKTRLAMSSIITYTGDRILTTEMMRAMIILYIGPNARPDFSTDYFLSPILTPESLLKQFPKTYLQTGERDPLVDHTVVFAGRLRQAKLAHWCERQELGLVQSHERFREEDWVDVLVVPGISHAFLQIVSIYPEGWKYIFRAAKWMADVFRECDVKALRDAEAKERRGRGRVDTPQGRKEEGDDESSSSEDDGPLEMGGGRGSPPKMLVGVNGSLANGTAKHEPSVRGRRASRIERNGN